ncbi:MAG: right-handed parallel beta-helix repeat-containing protein [Candidatus Omnitrophica bacterium]|nr:right-handed parallel beta-helix repeat-containing protein [Candidatus Omnitrophota bacterium]
MKKLILALLLLGVLFPAISFSATAINTCATTISSGGDYYLNVSLSCTGHGVTVSADNVNLNLNGKTIDGDDGTADRGILISSGTDNLVIENGSITDFGQGITNTGSTGNNGLIIRNVSVSSCAGSPANGRGIRLALDTGTLQNVLIQNVTVFNNAADGIYSGSSTGGTPTITNITIRDSRLYGNGNFGQIYVATPFSGQIINNSISSSGAAINGIDSSTASGVNITQNTFYNSTVAGIDLYNGNNTRVYGNLVHNTTLGIEIEQTGSNNLIENNTIRDGVGTSYGITLRTGATNNQINYNNVTAVTRGIGGQGAGTGGNNFTGNIVYYATSCANIGGVTGDTFTNNFLYNCTSEFINQIAVGSTTWYNNTFGYNATAGLINLTNFSTSAITEFTEGYNAYVQPDFISINSSIDGTTIPGSAGLITLETDAGCVNTTIYSKSGLPTTAADIRNNGVTGGIDANCTSGIATFYVSGFSGYALDAPPATAITLIAPSNGAVLSGTGTSLQYNLTTYDAVTCNTTLDGSVIDSQSFAISQMVNVTATASTGSHLWYVRCYLNANPAYYKTSATYSFSMSFSTYENSINLSTTVENVLDSPQSLFYDSTGNLTLLYFIDGVPTDTIHIATIANGAIAQNYTQLLNATKPFFAAFRNGTDTIILTFNTDNVTKHYLILNSTAMTIQNASTTYNVTPNVQYDPYAYANTKNIPTITNQTGSHYLFILPTTTDSRLIRMNYSLTTFQDLNTTNHNRKVTWGTIAKNANLTTWYYAWLSNASCNATSDRIQIWTYNSTAQIVNATPDTTCYGQADIEGSQVIFEQYGNNTYALISNITNRTVIHLIEENKTYLFNYTVSEHSPLIFLDEDTLIFFSREGTATYAYSCYFASAPACIRYSASDYGATVPFYSGNMTTAKRSGTSDVNAVGKVTNWDRLKLLYSEKTYDTKFICYDEMDEYRKAFTVQVFTQNTSQILKTPPSYGYALPSDMIGSGRKRAYFNCENGTLRLFLVGLNNDFTINSYSLDNTTGAYYTFNIQDAYGQPIQNITVTAQRFSNLAQSYVTIEQGVSDYTGSATLFLELFALYQVTIDANGYVPITFEFVPSGTYTVDITLATSNGTVITLPTYNRVFNDVSYTIAPNNGSFFEPSENLSYHVVSSNATLEYYGMEITKKHNGTTTTIYSVNTTTSPSGGLMGVQANDTGVYTVTTWFKAQNYSEYRPNPRIYYLGNATGLAGVRETLEGNTLISGWFYYLIAVGVTMLVAGFVSKYSTEGAGAVGLIVLWGFTMLYPHGVIFVAGTVGISIWMATVFTTLMVAAGFYIMKQGV